jgi:hypothetical protein
MCASQAARSKFQIENAQNRHFWTKGFRVRDREAPGSNPGPPTSFGFRAVKQRYTARARRAPGSQGDHKFLGEHRASSAFEVVPGPLLNSGIVIRRPIYQ